MADQQGGDLNLRTTQEIVTADNESGTGIFIKNLPEGCLI